MAILDHGLWLKGYLSEQDRRNRKASLKFLVLALFMLAVWWLAPGLELSRGEQALWYRVRSAQTDLSHWRKAKGFCAPPGADPWRLGLIGVEMSPLTTTQGGLKAKRTACDPAWSVAALRWFRNLGLKKGDPVAVFSSSSFPGLALNVLAAAEVYGLDVFLVVSLGSSTWGANHPACPWPVLAARLRGQGYLRIVADFYTLGGGRENGGGIPPEGLAILRQAAQSAGVRLVRTNSLKEMIDLKWRLVKERGVKLLINIGGGQAAMGSDEAVLKLGPGLLRPGPEIRGGNGVMGLALAHGVPVLHMLNLKSLCAQTGVSFDSPPSWRMAGGWSIGAYLLALAVFGLVLFRHDRWKPWPSQ